MNLTINKSFCGILLAAGLFLVFTGNAGADEERPPVRYTGMLRATYDYRSLGSSEDHDVYGYWYLRASDLAKCS